MFYTHNFLIMLPALARNEKNIALFKQSYGVFGSNIPFGDGNVLFTRAPNPDLDFADNVEWVLEPRIIGSDYAEIGVLPPFHP